LPFSGPEAKSRSCLCDIFSSPRFLEYSFPGACSAICIALCCALDTLGKPHSLEIPPGALAAQIVIPVGAQSMILPASE
jgi:hypothetical protein